MSNEYLKTLEHLRKSVSGILIDGKAVETIGDLASEGSDPEILAKLWKALIDRDTDKRTKNWFDTEIRIYLLISIFVGFEKLRTTRYSNLRDALAMIKTLSGKPLNIAGTRCEILTRSAEALFLTARRDPGSDKYKSMLRLAEEYFNILFDDCKQKDIPKYASHWYGMRGVCRQMLATSMNRMSKEAHALYSQAGEDLERALSLGNAGASAKTYLFDVLFHLLPLEETKPTQRRIQNLIGTLTESEKQDRGILFSLGRYYFVKSFTVPEAKQCLVDAAKFLNSSLSYPPVLSTDDAIIRIVRGQVYVRLSMEVENDTDAFMSYLNKGIDDLKFVIESAPDKYEKQTSLQSALQTRAKLFSRIRKYKEAKDDLMYSIGNTYLREANPALAIQAEVLIIITEIQEALDDDNLSLIELLLVKLLVHPAGTLGAFYAGIAAKKVFTKKPVCENPTLIKSVIDLMRRAFKENKGDNKTQRMYLSIRAGLEFMLGKSWDVNYLETAVATYQQAIQASDDPPMLQMLSLYADCCLQLAKKGLDSDNHDSRRIELLEEAAECFTKCAKESETKDNLVDETFKPVVTYSKAGEAWLRLCGFSGSTIEASEAIRCLEASRELGNDSHELQGLIGDAYYHMFKLTGALHFLTNAANSKAQARACGGVARENFSVSARLSFLQWEATSENCHLVDAIRFAAEAHEASSEWPWPPFQLAEIVKKTPSDFLITALENIRVQYPSLNLLRNLSGDIASQLISIGAILVLKNEEFSKKHLGGRQPVYIMEDPHRLLSESYVFKITNEQNAIRDRDAIIGFADFVNNKGLRGVRLPEPLAIIPQSAGKVAYVMRRAKGQQLGRVVIRSRRENVDTPVTEFSRSLKFLAAYHSWGGVATEGRESRRSIVTFVDEYLNDTLGPDSRQILPSIVRTTLHHLDCWATVVKKDAHPENWVVDDYKNICMIDFESGKKLPVLFEVVQLLEDYPLLDPSTSGLDLRKSLTQIYLSELKKQSSANLDIIEENWKFIYLLFTILRCGFGIPYCSRIVSAVSSSSALRAKKERISHYKQLLSWISSENHEGLGEFANAVLTKFSKA